MLEKTIEKSIPTLRRLAEPLAQWHAENRLKMDLARIGPSELDRVLADAGLTRRDLPSGLGDRRGSRTLMARMLSRFGIRPDRIAVRYQGALRDAERACARCDTTARCRRWLNRGAAKDTPRRFCPNAELFDEMGRNWRN